MKKVLNIGLYLLLIFCLFGQMQAQKVKTVDGVQVVENPEKPKSPKGILTKLILEEDFKIGDSEVEEEMIAQVTFFVVDENESIYALDWKANNIKVFDKNGKFVRTIGKQGQGPGEMNFPSGLLITPENELLVEDAGNTRQAYFTLEGEFLRNVSVADKTSLTNLVMDSKGNVLGRQFIIDEGAMSFEIRKFDKDLNNLFTIESIPFSFRDPQKDKMNPFDFVQIYFFDSEGKIYYGNPKEYEIQIFNSEGKLKKKITKKYKSEKITEEDIEKIMDRIPDMGFGLKNMMEFPKQFPAYEAFTIDEEGRLIVRSYNKAEGEDEVYLDIFDAEGKYISRFPTKVNPRIWKNNKLYALEETDEGFIVIKRYTISWQ
ncbi:MAG: 6-bladed beta-propeller [Candidatus Aminicenantes bacterium]|nr:6-bladed beta-propeller [Candidatus Aminicenantes bacterium]